MNIEVAIQDTREWSNKLDEDMDTPEDYCRRHDFHQCPSFCKRVEGTIDGFQCLHSVQHPIRCRLVENSLGTHCDDKDVCEPVIDAKGYWETELMPKTMKRHDKPL